MFSLVRVELNSYRTGSENERQANTTNKINREVLTKYFSIFIIPSTRRWHYKPDIVHGQDCGNSVLEVIWGCEWSF